MYRPDETKDMKTPLKLYVVKEYEKIKGVSKPIYEEAKDSIIYASFKTYGGSEREVNDRYVIEDTANIVTWYRPDIKSNCLLERLSDGAKFEILNEPENIDERNMFIKFKIKRYKGQS